MSQAINRRDISQWMTIPPVKIYNNATDRKRQDGGCAVGSDGEKEEGLLRRADRGEVKTKHADWQDLLSAGQPTASEQSGLQVGYCGPFLRVPRAPTCQRDTNAQRSRSCLRHVGDRTICSDHLLSPTSYNTGVQPSPAVSNTQDGKYPRA